MKSLIFVFTVVASLLLASCGTYSGSSPTSVTYTIGGTASGLAGTGLVLQDNGGNNLSVSASGSFTFTSAIVSGGSYSVTVLTQPSGPAQTCVVTSGSGTVTSANITSVVATCTTVTFTIGGTVINLAGAGGGLQLQDNGGDSLLVNANGSFTFPTALNSGSAYSVTVHMQPSAPAQTCAVTKGTGTATGNVTSVAVDCGHNEWTWMNGSSSANPKGTYGTQGTAAAGNVPGGRESADSWTDSNGNFWLFGGFGYDSTGTTVGFLNDLWRYSAGQWTWMGGSNLINHNGMYGTQGTAAAGNVPGARVSGTTWTDAAGNLWLFGGDGYDSAGTMAGRLNDLWKYSAGQWTWIGGSNIGAQKGTYGTQGMAAAGNIPGARSAALDWVDTAGSLWLFGGAGFDSTGTTDGYLNDLWKYSAGQWTWMGGSNVGNQNGTYGNQGTAAAGNVPGGREASIAWTDGPGNFWLFGGIGFGSVGIGYLNDLWKYSAGQWTWIGGSNGLDHGGTYGSQGTAAVGNVPGGRYGAVAWTDAAGNSWLFGGLGYGSFGPTHGHLNDLWKYSAGQWTWMGGSNVTNQNGTYGTQGTASLGNVPGPRLADTTWIDMAGNFWLFGGDGMDSTGTDGFLDDLWKYEP